MPLSRYLLAAGLLFSAAACSQAPDPGTTPAALPDRAALTREIEAQFARSARDWNAGNLEGFMSDYANDSTTSYLSGGAVRYGYDRIRSGYAPRFAPGAQRDSLHFENLAVRPLSGTLALVTARFILQREGRTTSSGPFTIIMERHAGGWKILHDHTSSD